MADGSSLPRVQRLSTATLILGVPGSGKTSLIATAAEYGWETYRKVLLLASWDGGAIPTLVQKRMKQGLIRYWRARTRSAAGLGIETTHLATKGYWPAVINPETGETPVDVRLVPPVTNVTEVRCPAGHLIYQGLPAAPAPRSCGTCKKIISPAEQNYTTSSKITRGFEDVGLRAFDGLTSMCTVVTEHMDLARGEGQIGGEKSAFGGVVTSGAVKFGGSNRADVGFAQTRALQWVNNALSIPHLVEGPIFTALSMEVADEGGLPVVGPQLSGRAATDSASAWFGNVAEMGRVADDQGKEHFALYLRPFTDKQNRRHLLKTSASPSGVPDVLIDPLDKPFTIATLGTVYKLLDQDLATSLAVQDFAELPAPPPAEYGETTALGANANTAVSAATPVPTPVKTPTPTPTSTATTAPPPGPRPVARPKPVPTPAPTPAPAAAVSAPEPASPAAPAAVSTPAPTGSGTAAPPPGKPPQRLPGS